MTYNVATYDPNDDPSKDGEWIEVAVGVSLWGLRSILRHLYRQGYDRDFSVFVARD